MIAYNGLLPFLFFLVCIYLIVLYTFSDLLLLLFLYVLAMYVWLIDCNGLQFLIPSRLSEMRIYTFKIIIFESFLSNTTTVSSVINKVEKQSS